LAVFGVVVVVGEAGGGAGYGGMGDTIVGDEESCGGNEDTIVGLWWLM
jgi:hypothetical protein